MMGELLLKGRKLVKQHCLDRYRLRVQKREGSRLAWRRRWSGRWGWRIRWCWSGRHRLARLHNRNLIERDRIERLVLGVSLHLRNGFGDQNAGRIALPKDGVVLIEGWLWS